MSTVWDIDDWIDQAAWSPIRRFYPTAVTKSVALPIQSVFEHLLLLTEQKKLSLLWEVRCPDCFYTVTPPEGQHFISGEELTCPLGHKFELDQNFLFPVFEIDNSYKEHVRDKKKDLKLGMLHRRVPQATR